MINGRYDSSYGFPDSGSKKSMIKVLHITGWYPNKSNPYEALWIKRHIEAVAAHVEEYFVLHLEIKPSNKLEFHKNPITNGIQRRLEVPLNSWFLIEIISAILLMFYLFKLRYRKFDIINVHIAYPLLVYWHLIKIFVSLPVIITEHWSGYHFNFGLPPSIKLSRVKRIFRQQIPVITVSQALASDLKIFSECDFPHLVVPNVVDASVYSCDESLQRQDYFFMLSQWQWPKRPDVIIRAFANLIQVKEYCNYQLKIGGYGIQLKEMKALVESLGMSRNVDFLGSLTSSEIAREMNQSAAFLHCSEYETFSVVCAEAISCGTPVIASAVGGIAEFINIENGNLLKSFAVEDWFSVLRNIRHADFDRAKISNLARGIFSAANVGSRYFNFLNQVNNT